MITDRKQTFAEFASSLDEKGYTEIPMKLKWESSGPDLSLTASYKNYAFTMRCDLAARKYWGYIGDQCVTGPDNFIEIEKQLIAFIDTKEKT